MILTVVTAGLFVVLMSSIGETPIYYHTLPEIQFVEILTSFTHLETNFKRTISEDSDRLFQVVIEKPISWNEEWVEYNAEFKEDFEDAYASRLGEAANSYFGSVYSLESAGVNVSLIDIYGSGSKVNYVDSSEKLIWDYRYRVALESRVIGSRVASEIDTERTFRTEFNFVNLKKAFDCSRNFFSGLSTTSYSFQTQNQEKLKEGLEQWFLRTMVSEELCSEMDISVEVSLSCSGFECNCRKMEPATVIFYLDEKGKGSVAFSKEFDGFRCGNLEAACDSGDEEECFEGEACINGWCGSCYSDYAGESCSPEGSAVTVNSDQYRCYETLESEYKCLEHYPAMRISFNDGTCVSDKGKVELNCGKEHKVMSILSGPENTFYTFNGVRINVAEPDLCDITYFPRSNGIIKIYSNLGADKYEISSFSVDFALTDAINKLEKRTGSFIYNFDTDTCSELRSKVSKDISDIVLQTAIEGYTWDIFINTICDSGETSWQKERYSEFKVEFKEEVSGRTVANFQSIVNYEPAIISAEKEDHCLEKTQEECIEDCGWDSENGECKTKENEVIS